MAEGAETIEADPAPVSRDVALSGRWLTSALQPAFPGVEVTGTEVVEVLRTVATKIRFRVRLAEGSRPLPTRSFCVKAYFDREEQGYRGGETEGAFYATLAAALPVSTPTSVYVGSDPRTGHTLVLMHDLVAEGARFLTALTPYSVEEAAGTLDQLALLHASRWADPGLLSVDWLASRLARIPDAFPVDLLQSQLDTRRGDPLPAPIRDAARLDAAVRALLAQEAHDAGDPASPLCLVHGDAHAGNVFVDAAGHPGLIDWQLVHRGCWALDVAYHIGAVLDVQHRRDAEGELLDHYLARLAAHGAPAPPRDRAFELYRRYLVYGYYLWAITRFVEEDITVEFVRRLGTAVADHHSFELVGA